MIILRRELGDALRAARQRQGRTLREVSGVARVSLGYLSEVERGQKEASSELLSSICEALDVPMSRVLRDVSDRVAAAEHPDGAGRDRSRGADVLTLDAPAPADPIDDALDGALDDALDDAIEEALDASLDASFDAPLDGSVDLSVAREVGRGAGGPSARAQLVNAA